jgi:hypothetical protein
MADSNGLSAIMSAVFRNLVRPVQTNVFWSELDAKWSDSG